MIGGQQRGGAPATNFICNAQCRALLSTCLLLFFWSSLAIPAVSPPFSLRTRLFVITVLKFPEPHQSGRCQSRNGAQVVSRVWELTALVL
jgi:hypothetical protein